VLLSDRTRSKMKAAKLLSVPKSKVLGFIPTGQYPSAVAFADGKLFIGNGKGTGFEPSSMRVNDSGRTPNPPNAAFPPIKKKTAKAGSTAARLFQETSAWSRCPICRNSAIPGKSAERRSDGFRARETFPRSKAHQHVIYIIKEKPHVRQVFGDGETSGDGTAAVWRACVCDFWQRRNPQRPDGTPQNR